MYVWLQNDTHNFNWNGWKNFFVEEQLSLMNFKCLEQKFCLLYRKLDFQSCFSSFSSPFFFFAFFIKKGFLVQTTAATYLNSEESPFF